MKLQIFNTKLGLLAAKIYWKSWRHLGLSEDEIVSIALHAEHDSKKRYDPKYGLSFETYLKLNGANFIKSSYRSLMNKVDDLIDFKDMKTLEEQNTVSYTPENYLRSVEFREMVHLAFKKAKNEDERQVFALYVKGYKNLEIAKKLNLTTRRVRYLISIFKDHIKVLTKRYGY